MSSRIHDHRIGSLYLRAEHLRQEQDVAQVSLALGVTRTPELMSMGMEENNQVLVGPDR